MVVLSVAGLANTILVLLDVLAGRSTHFASARTETVLQLIGNERLIGRKSFNRTNPRVQKKVCRKCAVRFDSLCAKSSLFNTSSKCFRAGLVVSK